MKRKKIPERKKIPVSENPPTKAEVESYAIEWNVPASVGARAWEYYTTNEWFDKNDDPVYRWRGKVLMNFINRYRDDQDGTSKRFSKSETGADIFSKNISQLSRRS